MRLALISAATMIGTGILATPLLAQENSGRPLTIALEGSQEVPGPGDPDGFGTATVRINPGRGQICYSLGVSAIGPATGAHIHEAEAGSAGPVVVSLQAPTGGSSNGCISVGRELAFEILREPGDYYVNVHNEEYPAGALRGQLDR